MPVSLNKKEVIQHYLTTMDMHITADYFNIDYSYVSKIVSRTMLLYRSTHRLFDVYKYDTKYYLAKEFNKHDWYIAWQLLERNIFKDYAIFLSEDYTYFKKFKKV